MGSITRELESWAEKLKECSESIEIFQAIDKLIELEHPDIEDFLINIMQSERTEEIRIKAIQVLKKIKLSDIFRIFNILKNLLKDESKYIRKSAIRAIVDLNGVSFIKFLTQYYYSSYGEGLKTEIMSAIDDLSKILEEKKQKKKLNIDQKKIIQKKLGNESPRKEKDIDYKDYIKKFFE